MLLVELISSSYNLSKHFTVFLKYVITPLYFHLVKEMQFFVLLINFLKLFNMIFLMNMIAILSSMCNDVAEKELTESPVSNLIAQISQR